MDGSEEDELERHFRIRVDDVGDVLGVTMGVRHRQLTADWMLRYVSLTNVASGDLRFFPCHRVVLSRVTLRPGNGEKSILKGTNTQRSGHMDQRISN